MHNYRVHIESLNVEHRWIKQFIDDLEKKRVHTEYILHFPRLLDVMGNEHDAQKAYKKVKAQNFTCTMHLLLPPQEYTHAPMDIDWYRSALQSNPQAIVVYDTKRIKYQSPDGSMGGKELHALAKSLEKQYGRKRVLCRRLALIHVNNICGNWLRQWKRRNTAYA